MRKVVIIGRVCPKCGKDMVGEVCSSCIAEKVKESIDKLPYLKEHKEVK